MIYKLIVEKWEKWLTGLSRNKPDERSMSKLLFNHLRLTSSARRARVMGILIIECFPQTSLVFAYLLCSPILLKKIWIAVLFFFFHLLALTKGSVVFLLLCLSKWVIFVYILSLSYILRLLQLHPESSKNRSEALNSL